MATPLNDENSLQELSAIQNGSYETDLSASQGIEVKDSDTLLVELVAKYPLIYNKELKEYKHNSMRENCWLRISIILNKTASECSKRWSQLRNNYSREKKRREIETRSGSGLSKRKGFALYETMSFLKEHIRKRKHVFHETPFRLNGTFTNATRESMSSSHIRMPFMPINVQSCDIGRFTAQPLHLPIPRMTVLSETTSAVPYRTPMPPPRMPKTLQFSDSPTLIPQSQTILTPRTLPVTSSTLIPQESYMDTSLSYSRFRHANNDLSITSDNEASTEKDRSCHLLIPPVTTLPVETPTPSPHTTSPSLSTPILSPNTPPQSPETFTPSPRPKTSHQAHITSEEAPGSQTALTNSILTRPSTLTSPESPYSQQSSFGDASSLCSGLDIGENVEWVYASNAKVLPERPNSCSPRNSSSSRSASGPDTTRCSSANVYRQENVKLPRNLPQPEACFNKDSMKNKKMDRFEASLLNLTSVLQNHFENSASKATVHTAATSSEQAFGNLIATELEKLTEPNKTNKKARLLQVLYE